MLSLLLPAQAQTFAVLHTFSGADGEYPYSGVTIQGSHLFGTTSRGGANQSGVAYELKHVNSGWAETILHNFGNGNDGTVPYAAPVFGPSGILYGTASLGGSGNGVVYSLQPPATVCTAVSCPWTEALLWTFQGGDGSTPAYGA
ncbi:MAG TPA: choice-of-anchor tandem repeat GloVer-containing protein, partial [Bryocella sp.]|nr:choice-of-anchor tandem repeat GloVer-containing protein [Bryocella sp.]